MMEKFAFTPESSESQLFVPAELLQAQRVSRISLRSERAYDLSTDPLVLVRSSLARLVTTFSQGVFLVFSLNGSDPIGAVRTKKWSMESKENFGDLPFVATEVATSEEHSRLYTVVDLSGYDFEKDSMSLLNIVTSTFDSALVLSTAGFEQVIERASSWLASDGFSSFNIDWSAVLDFLNDDQESVAVRYEFADNGWHEWMAVVGHDGANLKAVESELEKIELDYHVTEHQIEKIERSEQDRRTKMLALRA